MKIKYEDGTEKEFTVLSGADAVAAARYCDSCIAVLKGMREASPTPHALSVLRDLCVIDF